MTYLAAGFLLGLAGSVHCLGMCGPLVLLSGSPARGPGCSGPDWPRFAAHHAGRLAVYLVLGTAAGLAGAAVAAAGWRRWLAIAAGAALLAQAAGLTERLVGARPGRWMAARLSRASRRLPRHRTARSAALGVVNGLMPCGLLYAALAGAAGLGRWPEAIGFMAAFGAGSLPMFGALTASARTIMPRVPARLRQAAPIALAVLGLLLIARGWPDSQPHGASPHTTPHLSRR